VTVDAAASEAFPSVTVVYRCSCGTSECRHGRKAGLVPPGWTRFVAVDGTVLDVCPACSGPEKPA